MKTMKLKGRWIALASIVGLLAVAVPSFAWYGQGGGPGMGYGVQCNRGYGMGMGYGMMGPATAAPTLTAAQQKQVSAIQSKYQPQLAIPAGREFAFCGWFVQFAS